MSVKTTFLRKRRLSKNTKESYAIEQRGNGAFCSSRILHNAPNVTPINAADAVSCFGKNRPIMKPKTIASQMMKGMAAGLKHVFPVCWYLVYPLMVLIPTVRHACRVLEPPNSTVI